MRACQGGVCVCPSFSRSCKAFKAGWGYVEIHISSKSKMVRFWALRQWLQSYCNHARVAYSSGKDSGAGTISSTLTCIHTDAQVRAVVNIAYLYIVSGQISNNNLFSAWSRSRQCQFWSLWLHLEMACCLFAWSSYSKVDIFLSKFVGMLSLRPLSPTPTSQ